MVRMHTLESVISFVESLGYKLLDNKYINNRTKFTIVDADGYYYYTNLFNLQSGRNPSKFHITNPYTLQNIKRWCEINNKPYYLVSNEYKCSNSKLRFQCLREECGEIFEATWGNIQSGWGCSYCSGKKVGISNCLTVKNPELASEWHPSKNGSLTPNDVTCYSKKMVWWLCKKDKTHIWRATVSNRYYNQSGCPYCRGRLASQNNNLFVDNPILCEEWDYIKNNRKPEDYLPNSNKHVWWICKECNFNWKATINNRNSSLSGCPICNSSKGEKIIGSYLKNNNINYIPQYRFKECKNIIPLPFDFYLPDFNLCIEYHGIQHYKPVKHFGGIEQLKIRKRNDKIKSQFCNDNSISLLVIPYFEFDNIENILAKQLLLECKEAVNN